MKTVLITGASGGIGAAAAKAFARNGYAVALHYHQNRDRAQALCAQLIADGADAFCVGADVASDAQVQQMLQTVMTRFGHLDVLINNAGVAHQALFTDTNAAAWDGVLAVNLNGAANCCRHAVPHMVRRHSGAIINVSSVWGIAGAACEVAYSAAKAGLVGLTRALAKELGPSGITVNCGAPGVIDTAMNAQFDADTMRDLAEQTPLGRIGKPEEVAAALLFLAGDGARFITGQTLTVDGGFAL